MEENDCLAKSKEEGLLTPLVHSVSIVTMSLCAALQDDDNSDEELEYDPSMYPQRVGRQKHVLDIEFHFNDGRRGGLNRGGRGGRPRGVGGPNNAGGERGERRGPNRNRNERNNDRNERNDRTDRNDRNDRSDRNDNNEGNERSEGDRPPRPPRGERRGPYGVS